MKKTDGKNQENVREHIATSNGLKNTMRYFKSSLHSTPARASSFINETISNSEHETLVTIASHYEQRFARKAEDFTSIESRSPIASPEDKSEPFDWEGRSDTGSSPLGYDRPKICHVAENICRTSRHKFWFYFGGENEDLASIHGIHYPKQPLITYIKRGRSMARRNMGVSSFAKNATWINEQQCVISPIENHVVLSADHAQMMGEYVQRIIMPMHHLMQDYVSYSKANTSQSKEVQFYLYFHQNEGQQILPSHHLYMNGLPFGDNLRSWVEEVDPPPSIHSSACQCYSRLVFCGYNGFSRPAKMNYAIPNDDVTELVLSPDSSVPFNLSKHCAHYFMPTDAWKYDNCTVWQDLRLSIIQMYERRKPDVHKDIAAYRMKLILDSLPRHTLATQSSLRIDDVNDWKIIALSQRRRGRVWLNINETLSHCNDKYHSFRIVCIVVDVESLPTQFVSASNNQPLSAIDEQFVLYRSIDALIGIHGSQLTQGILMPSNSILVELLPWLPSKEWGIKIRGDGWTNQKNRPTPIGIMWHNTDINEAGFDLTRESVPLCQNVSEHQMHDFSQDKNSNKEINNTQKNGRISELQYCLQTTHINKFKWDVRNFTVGLNMIEKFVDTFFHFLVDAVSETSSDLIPGVPYCNEWRERGKSNGFTLYNLICMSKNGTVSAHHFYHS
ncbi:hypothetical protein HJC23_000077 [Cyclotella cryptica]|uniref:Glycosyltransferase 61 catalytic domain-containing protein n=1 Tax=Cyclotella cryptica TaxID=29204 RepID=A0ABD3PIY5_9STRA